MKKKKPIKKTRSVKIAGGTMVARTYTLLTDCLEAGADIGYSRAHKHTDEPAADDIKEAIVRAQMNEICERFDFVDVPRQQDE